MSVTLNTTSHGPTPGSDDDRLDPRYEGQLEAFVIFRGAPWRCWIRDLSLGGAGLEPALPAMLGQSVELTCPSFAFAGGLPGRVINVADRRTCVAFDLKPEHLDALAGFLRPTSTRADLKTDNLCWSIPPPPSPAGKTSPSATRVPGRSRHDYHLRQN